MSFSFLVASRPVVTATIFFCPGLNVKRKDGVGRQRGKGVSPIIAQMLFQLSLKIKFRIYKIVLG